jgi:hypothetical protein
MIDHHRLPRLDALLMGRRTPRYPAIPRHLWGDVGLTDEALPRLARIR